MVRAPWPAAPQRREPCRRKAFPPDLPRGNTEELDRAVQTARRAFRAYAATSREERIELLQGIMTVFKARKEEMAEAIMQGSAWPGDHLRDPSRRLG